MSMDWQGMTNQDGVYESNSTTLSGLDMTVYQGPASNNILEPVKEVKRQLFTFRVLSVFFCPLYPDPPSSSIMIHGPSPWPSLVSVSPVTETHIKPPE